MTRADDVYFATSRDFLRHRIPKSNIKLNKDGDRVRDWTISEPNATLFPNHTNLQPIPEMIDSPTNRFLWPQRTHLWIRREPNGNHREIDLTWYEWSRFQRERFLAPLSIAFAFVATHNHVVLDRGGKVFKQSAPIIKLPSDATEDDHLALLGLLNSSTACFWMQQVFHNKGGPGGGSSKDEKWHDFYEHDSTKLRKFPIPQGKPTVLARHVNQLAQEHIANLPASVITKALPTREDLEQSRGEATRHCTRQNHIG
jgi:hypothetical protein